MGSKISGQIWSYHIKLDWDESFPIGVELEDTSGSDENKFTGLGQSYYIKQSRAG